MKQGILITAYKNFEHLIDIATCFDVNFEIYIHIDKKSTIKVEVIDELMALKNVKLVSRKYKVNWGGVNHLKCILHLAEEALKVPELENFHLITGHDFPIKNTDHFIDFFKKNSVTDFLDYFELPDNQWPHGGLDRLEYYNLYDVLDAKKYRPYIFKLVNFQRKWHIKRSISKKVPKLYGGESYWSLTRETLQYVINYTKENPYLLKRLKHSFCSEEIYFQTVIMNSEHASKVVNDSLRYIDWTKRNGNFPANLDLSDLDKIKLSNKLFARKFEFPVSNELRLYLKKNIFS
ncbi:MAG TPA: beta-1,6-N-acetylglucosaminyltransferase [Lutibacter sp.]